MATYLITGANRGIGLELTRQLRQRDQSVIAVCRQASQPLKALDVEIITDVDVTDDDSVGRLARELQGRTIDVLINNAGVLTNQTLDTLNFEAIRGQYEVNALGPLRITAALRHQLDAGSKVVIITSRMGSIGDNTSGGHYGYRMSKAAVNMAGVSLAQDLHPAGIAVLILHPGMVATDMTGRRGIDVAESASNLLARIDEFGLDETGSFHHANGEPLPW